MKMSKLKQVELTNVGPIERLAIEIPESGVVVLRGRNGCGKSKALEAVEAAAGGATKGLTVKDGEVSGKVEAFGVTVKLGRSNRRTGELEVESLTGRLNIADLVDPKVKDEGAADGRRIKALVQLTGVEASPELFVQCLGSREKFDAIVTAETQQTPDLVQLAEATKRDIERVARAEEDKRDKAATKASTMLELTEGIDISGECDAAILRSNFEKALEEKARLFQADADAEKAIERDRKSRKTIDDLVAARTGPTIEELEKRLAIEEKATKTLEDSVERREEELRDQRLAVEETRRRYDSTVEMLERTRESVAASRQIEQQLDSIRETISDDLPTRISNESIEAAEAIAEKAHAAISTGEEISTAIGRKLEAELILGLAGEHRANATSLRESAKLTDEVLSDVVGRLSELKVEAGRLIAETSRGKTYFSELSHGERWRLALDIAIVAIGEGGLLTIPQDAWEPLDPENRQLIADHVREKNVVVLTAEAASNEDIEVEVLEADENVDGGALYDGDRRRIVSR